MAAEDYDVALHREVVSHVLVELFAVGRREYHLVVVALCLHGAELVRDSVGKVSVYARPGLGLLRAKLGSGHGLGCNADGFDAQVALALELEARLASEDGRLIYHG